MNAIRAVFVASALFTSSLALAADEHQHMMPPAKTNKSFEQLKQLVGTWEAKTKMGDKEQTVTATYELTSGGSAVLERLFAGTPHEMVSVYHTSGDSIAMTHYCMLGNQPKMVLKKSDAGSMAFEMEGSAGIQSAKEMHMHALNIKWGAKNSTVTEEWISYNDGKVADTKVFTLTKK